DAVEILVILRSGKRPLRRVGIDREAVEVIAAAGHGMGADLPLGEGAVEIARDRAAHLGDFDILVVVGVLQMGGEVLPQSALAGFRNHGFRPSALKQRLRISVSGWTDSSISVGSTWPPSFKCALMASSRSRTCASDARICATSLCSIEGRRDR